MTIRITKMNAIITIAIAPNSRPKKMATADKEITSQRSKY